MTRQAHHHCGRERWMDKTHTIRCFRRVNSAAERFHMLDICKAQVVMTLSVGEWRG